MTGGIALLALGFLLRAFLPNQSVDRGFTHTSNTPLMKYETFGEGTPDPTPMPLAGPFTDTLLHDPKKGNVLAKTAQVNVRNFITEVRLYNPYDSNTNDWDYGIGFRQNSNSVRNYRLSVHSDKSWTLCLYDGNATPHCPVIAQGIIAKLDISPNGSNVLRLEVKDDHAKLFVNEILIDTLNVSVLDLPGIVSVMIEYQVEGKATRYEDFTVWPLQ